MKSFKHYLLIIAICVIPFIAVFATPRMIHTHDGPMHLARAPAYFKALSGGQIMPRWTGYLNYGYGMPLFNFYYHMPYLIASGFIALGANLTLSFKLTMFLGFIVSGVFMYMFSYAFFRHHPKALLMTLMYQFAPFHMVDMFVRGNSGEVLTMTFFPLALYGIWKGFASRQTLKYITITGVAVALLILSHSAVSLMYFGALVIFALVFAPDGTKRRLALYGLGTGLLLSAFYWLPVLAERKYTYGDFYTREMYKSQIVPILRFFIPNLTNDPRLQVGGVDISFGFLHTVALATGIWLLITKKLQKQNRRVVLYSIGLTALAVLLMTKASLPLWQNVSFLRAFQFPWRFLSVVVFSLSFLGGAVLIQKSTPRSLILGMMGIALFSSLVYWRPPLGFDRIDESYFWKYPLDTTFFGETNLVWSAGHQSAYPKAPFEIIKGNGTITDTVKHETRHTFTVIAQTPVQILDNTQYYPGWRVYSGNTKLPIEFQDPNHRGNITFRLPAGTHHVRVVFGETPIRIIAETLTVSTVLVLAAILIWHKNKRPKV